LQSEVKDVPIVTSVIAAPEFQFRPDTFAGYAQVMDAESRLDGRVPPLFGAASGGPCAFENLQIARREDEFRGGRLLSENHLFRYRVTRKRGWPAMRSPGL
jgi:hypothetical protein